MTLRRLLFALPLIALLANAPVALAATCCSCHPSGNASKNICLTDPSQSCDNIITQSANANLKGWTCDPAPLDASSSCLPISSGNASAKCMEGPTDAKAYGNTNATSTVNRTFDTPQLNVRIPGLEFASKLPIEDGKVQVPYFAQYISAVYNYLLGITAIAAAIMIVYGGFLYIVGASLSSIEHGREIIKDAIIGIVLMFGSVTILQLINPATTKPAILSIPLVNGVPYNIAANQLAGGAADANNIMHEIGVDPTGSGLSDTLPTDCPGRDRSYTADGSFPLEIYKKTNPKGFPRANYALVCPSRGKNTLDQDTINAYLDKQKQTGVPAGILMAIIRIEGGNCAIYSSLQPPGGSDFGNTIGEGCSVSEVPAGVCPHVAFPQMVKGENLDCNTFNNYLPACVQACQNSTRDTYTTCGDCFPLKSSASALVDGHAVIIPSVQCSKKVKKTDDLFGTMAARLAACKPFQNSVYKFAYCIGASSYYGATGEYGILMAEIIQRNCLCNPATDADHCQRSPDIEAKLKDAMMKRINPSLYTDYKTHSVKYDQFLDQIANTTGGLLKPGYQSNPDATLTNEQ